MDGDLFTYIQQLELLAFFSGYPLIYALGMAWASAIRNETHRPRLRAALPLSYALVGSLYVGMQWSNGFPVQENWLFGLAMLSLLFWFPPFFARPILSLLHSLPFFFLLLRELYFHATGQVDQSQLANNMKVYTDSLLLNVACVAVLFVGIYLFSRIRKAIS